MSVTEHIDTNLPSDDGYETPSLKEYGAIEEWTQGRQAAAVDLSLIL